MIAQSPNLSYTHSTSLKNKLNHDYYPQNSLPSSLTSGLPQRNTVIDWLYRSQLLLHYSRSTLFMAISLLDKLLIRDWPLNDCSLDLLGATLLLLSTKFNEVYPVSFRKLNALTQQPQPLSHFIETQAKILTSINFDLTPDDPIYEQLAELQDKLGEEIHETVKLALMNPNVAFRMGSRALLTAIESLAVGGLMERRNQNRLQRESAELKRELQGLRLRSPSLRRLVSPNRA